MHHAQRNGNTTVNRSTRRRKGYQFLWTSSCVERDARIGHTLLSLIRPLPPFAPRRLAVPTLPVSAKSISIWRTRLSVQVNRSDNPRSPLNTLVFQQPALSLSFA